MPLRALKPVHNITMTTTLRLSNWVRKNSKKTLEKKKKSHVCGYENMRAESRSRLLKSRVQAPDSDQDSRLLCL